ncbi:MAG: 30S ribosomal protein S4 [Candidatus Bathyarchaeia archaeon]
MGDPKRQRKKYEAPRYPWSRDRIEAELKLLGEYGLRNKHELQRHRATLSKYRTMARELLAKTPDERAEMEEQLLGKLYRLGLIQEGATIDNVFDLSIEDILERRLQTLVLRQGLANTPQQARQLITHRHIHVRGRIVTIPSYTVPRDEESTIVYAPTSPLSSKDHPLQKVIRETKGKAETPERMARDEGGPRRRVR